MNRFYWMIAAVLLAGLSSCTAPLPEPSPAPTDLVLPTNTPEPAPTLAETIIPALDVYFDGLECSYAGPQQLHQGDYVFRFKDQSGQQAEFWLVYLIDGKSLQDLLDMQSEPGEWDPKPDWALYDSRLTGSFESVATDDGREDTSTWRLRAKGEHVLFCYLSSPQRIYYAGSVLIEEKPSD